jgi:hypothetical protein
MSKHARLIETQKWNAYQTKSKPGLLVYNPAGHGMQTEDDTAPVASATQSQTRLGCENPWWGSSQRMKCKCSYAIQYENSMSMPDFAFNPRQIQVML